MATSNSQQPAVGSLPTAAVSEVVEAEGHLIDSQVLSAVFDAVVKRNASFDVLKFNIGRSNEEPSRISMRSFASRFDSGSSMRSTSGLVTRARASATRCCWPPERRSGISSAHRPIWTRSMYSCARARMSLRGKSMLRSPNSTFLRTLRCGKMA